MPAARGQAAQTGQEAQAYAARVVNEAQGDASRFLSVYEEYIKAPEVTRRRMYLETDRAEESPRPLQAQLDRLSAAFAVG